MKAYLCTYRHYWPTPAQRRKTAEAAKNDHLLQEFLDGYDDSFYDWGDDPSFFCALHRLGSVNKASWGVCRRDVRSALNEGDVVVFFCARQDKTERRWDYYFVGFGTVKSVVDRRKLWTDAAYKEYRSLYNVLAYYDGTKFTQKEYFYPYHDDWNTVRGAAPYIIFDSKKSAFNVTSPHHVARWRAGENPREVWNGDQRSKQIEKILFEERGISRRLRTSTTGYAHTKLNLTTGGGAERTGRSFDVLRGDLRKLV